MGAYYRTRHQVKGVFAWVPISDLSACFYLSLNRESRFAQDILKCTSGSRTYDENEARKRSPLFWDLPEKPKGRLEIRCCQNTVFPEWNSLPNKAPSRQSTFQKHTHRGRCRPAETFRFPRAGASFRHFRHGAAMRPSPGARSPCPPADLSATVRPKVPNPPGPPRIFFWIWRSAG